MVDAGEQRVQSEPLREGAHELPVALEPDVATADRLGPPGVRWYPLPLPAKRCRRTTSPACSSWRKRLLSSEEDINGTPRWMSLKRRLPVSASSRITSGVQRSVSTSAACAIAQNGP